ncbi:acyl-CoA dehydrogenase family protein [Minwuia sp.]|uniref:acyl-CoA dehydrogenase family protein n=1 Tax=Minwuia sp. TaxID=2493630 RepID=UPI003A91489B
MQDLVGFARQKVAPRADELIRSTEFPADLWAEMGSNGWLGFAMGTYGGIDASPLELFDTAAAFAEAAEVVGFCTPWMTHHMVATRIVGQHADAEQAARWMGRFARGDSSACIAISEPGAGAHPKRLTTRAEKTATGWRLNGEKAWLTNGPLADVFVVVAITDVVDGRKTFGAFLVPEDAPGLSRTEGIAIDYVRPAGHCGLKLENVDLADDAYLAGAGDAVETVLKRFRRVEDTIGLAVKAGIARVQLRRLGALLSSEQAGELGALAADRDLYHAAARQLMDDSGGDPVSTEHEGRLLALRSLGRRFQDRVMALLEPVNGRDPFLDLLCRDMSKLGGVAAGVDQAKHVKRGAGLIG